MWRRLLVWLGLVSLAFLLWLPGARAQSQPAAPAIPAEGPRTVAFQYVVAFLSFLLVMVIVCSPSRKN
jgi:hypothetical protein